jgi:hypothetical protein
MQNKRKTKTRQTKMLCRSKGKEKLTKVHFPKLGLLHSCGGTPIFPATAPENTLDGTNLHGYQFVGTLSAK